MKARVDENGNLLGIYTEEFLNINFESLGVENWILTENIPTEWLLKGQLINEIWIETATQEELANYEL